MLFEEVLVQNVQLVAVFIFAYSEYILNPFVVKVLVIQPFEVMRLERCKHLELISYLYGFTCVLVLNVARVKL